MAPNHLEQRQRTEKLLKEQGLDAALFTHPPNITWLSGVSFPTPFLPNVFAGGPPLLWFQEGQFTLLVTDDLAERAAGFAAQPGCAVLAYTAHTIDHPLPGLNNLLHAFRGLLKNPPIWVGVEEADLSANILGVLQRVCPKTETLPVDGWLEPLRAVKTEEEIRSLRLNFHLTDIGQARARQALRPGMREIDLWTEVQSAIEQAAGERVALGNDLVVGTRPSNSGGWPLDHGIRSGDSVIVDLSTGVQGYWSDSCATYFAGEAEERKLKVVRVVREALDFGIALVKPGAVAGEIDRQIRDFIARQGYTPYTHHSGHGMGVTGHEMPRIVPGNRDVLQAGMVIMLEPGIYFPGDFGVRLEGGLLVTEQGAEILTHHLRS